MRNYIGFLSVLLMLLNFCFVPAFAQTGNDRYIPNSQLILSGYGGGIFNNMNVANNDVYPSPIHAPTALTFDPKIALDFQRTTKYRMIWGGGIEFGSKRQDVDIVYPSFDYVDTTYGFRNSSANISYRNKAYYLGARLTIGYTLPIKRDSDKLFDLEANMTVIKTFVFDGGELSYGLVASNISNDTLYAQWYDVTKLSGLWGDRGLPMGGFLYMELNIGIRKHVNWLRSNVYLGIYGCASEPFFSKANEANSDIDIRNGHYLNGQFQYFDHDYYIGKDFALGLKLGIGLKL